jgi:broad-specificity NMP kinase
MSSDARLRSGDDSRRLPIIELIGTPGAGKTVLSTEIIELLHERGWAASTIIGAAREHARRTPAGRLVVRSTSGRVQRFLLWWVFYLLASIHALAFVVEERRLTRTVLRTQLRRPIRLARRVQICFWFFQLAGRQRFLRATARDREVLVVDDGFLHRAVHIYASHAEVPSRRAIARYVDLLSAPSLVVNVRCDEETCELRVRRRGVWRHSRRLTVGELSRYLMRSNIVVDIASQRARERGWRVAEVDNDDESVGTAHAALASVLVAVFPPSKPGAGRAAGAHA